MIHKNQMIPCCEMCGMPLSEPDTVAEFDGVSVDLGLMTCEFPPDRGPVNISPRQAQGLLLLIRARGRIVPFSTFEDHIWPEEQGERFNLAESVRVLVYQLRGLGLLNIITASGLGYRLGDTHDDDHLCDFPTAQIVAGEPWILREGWGG